MISSARLKSTILGVRGVWIALIPIKIFKLFNTVLKPRAFLMMKSVFFSHEVCNYSYHNTEISTHRLAALLANLEGAACEEVLRYCGEVGNDGAIGEIYRNARSKEEVLRNLTDDELRIGRRLLYFCLVRILKPRCVFEAGTAHGIGSLIILHALKLNENEGYSGQLITADVNPSAGKLIKHLPADYRRLLDFRIGRSETVLANSASEIDVFFHDTMNIASHETRHYELLREKLSSRGVICTTWGTAGTLAAFSNLNGRRYLEFTNEALDHWFSDTLGISFPAAVGQGALH